MKPDATPVTTLVRPFLGTAARLLSRQLTGMVRQDWNEGCLIVSYSDIRPPKNFMGWPVRWERANGN
jgi:hypothetical protein